MIRQIRSNQGQSLAQLLVGIGVISIVMLGMTAMLTSAQREARALSEKLAAVDFERVMKASLGDGSVCRYLLNNPTPLTFNSTRLPQTITLPPSAGGAPPAIFASILPGPAPGPVVAQVGAPVSSISGSATVRSIQFQITQGSSGSYRGNWLVNFDDAGLVRSLKSVSVEARVTADDVTDPTRARVSDCFVGSGTPSGVPFYKVYWDQTNSCRTNPTNFTKSVQGSYSSVGDIFISPYSGYPSALYEMRLTSSKPVTVTQHLRYVDGQVSFWLNGARIADQTTTGLVNRTVTWNFVKGENLIQVVANNCDGGYYMSVILLGGFFIRPGDDDGQPELQFIR